MWSRATVNDRGNHFTRLRPECGHEGDKKIPATRLRHQHHGRCNRAGLCQRSLRRQYTESRRYPRDSTPHAARRSVCKGRVRVLQLAWRGTRVDHCRACMPSRLDRAKRSFENYRAPDAQIVGRVHQVGRGRVH